MFLSEEVVNSVVIRMERRTTTGRFIVKATVDLVVLGNEQGKRDELICERIERDAARTTVRTRIEVSVSLMTIIASASPRASDKRSGDPFGAARSVRSFVTSRILDAIVVFRFRV